MVLLYLRAGWAETKVRLIDAASLVSLSDSCNYLDINDPIPNEDYSAPAFISHDTYNRL